jgi:hypothetical protein
MGPCSPQCRCQDGQPRSTPGRPRQNPDRYCSPAPSSRPPAPPPKQPRLLFVPLRPHAPLYTLPPPLRLSLRPHRGAPSPHLNHPDRPRPSIRHQPSFRPSISSLYINPDLSQTKSIQPQTAVATLLPRPLPLAPDPATSQSCGGGVRGQIGGRRRRGAKWLRTEYS